MNGFMMRNGMMVEATPANVRAAQPAGMLTYTVAANFTCNTSDRALLPDGVTTVVRNDQVVSLRAGQTLHLTAAKAATLTGLGAVLTLVP